MVVCSGLAPASEGAEQTDRIASGCESCHQDTLSLAEYDSESLVVTIQAIRDQTAFHPPQKSLDGLSEEDIGHLVDKLTHPE
jgi:cytochrome c553